MSFRSSDDSAIRALRALSREAAEAEVPAIDWDRVEQGLFAEIARGNRPAPLEALSSPAPVVAPARVGSPWTAALTAAAAIALFAGVWHAESVVPVRGSEHAARTPLSVRGITLGDSLLPGDVVEAKERPLAYEKPGLVTFTVAPSSRVQLVAAERIGDGPGAVTISLAEGSVHAEVQPQPDGEAFAVEVGRTRVAVHGTSFTVSRQGDRVRVEVAHGSVAVGPANHRGSTQGWLLVGPDQATFSLDGAREAQWLAAPALETVRAVASPSERSPATSAGSPSSASGALAAAPPAVRGGHGVGRAESTLRPADDDASEKQAAVERRPSTAVAVARVEQGDPVAAAILSGLEACYERQASSFGVKFSIKSSLTLSILPNGTIHEGVFDPPLSPTLMGCAQEAIFSSRFPAGAGARQIRIPVALSRP